MKRGEKCDFLITSATGGSGETAWERKSKCARARIEARANHFFPQDEGREK